MPPGPDPNVLAYTALRDWLDTEQNVAAMDTAELTAELVKIDRPEGAQELFYFGLLNLQLKNLSSWTQARDAFLELSEAPELTREQRQLATILARYNQTRINWYLEYRKARDTIATMQSQLEATQQENSLLEQKIQAITELETSISTRKEP